LLLQPIPSINPKPALAYHIMADSIIVQRDTLDWPSLDLQAFRQASIDFCRNWGKADDFAYELARLWNSTFALNYFETRARLKNISQQHNAAIEKADFIAFTDGRQIPLRDGVYVFVDDDDWFSPQLGSILDQRELDSFDFLLWRTSIIGSPNQPAPVFYWGLNGRCMTNNYAVSSNWIQGAGSIAEVYTHAAAIRTLTAASTIEQLDLCLSVANKGPISSVSLDRGLGRSREPAKLLAMVDAYLKRMATLAAADMAHIPWAGPLIDATVTVYQDVYDSRY
jgi:hypothetical protein